MLTGICREVAEGWNEFVFILTHQVLLTRDRSVHGFHKPEAPTAHRCVFHLGTLSTSKLEGFISLNLWLIP